MTEPLEEGDLVRLHSGGGPVMSVQAIDAGRAVCMWFDAEGRLQERPFLLTTLEKVSDDSGVSGS